MTLTDILSRKRCLLLDFDGPICSVFAGYPAAAVAAQLQDLIRHRLGTVPPGIGELSSNPLNILRQIAALGDGDLTHAVAHACRDAELTAVKSAIPTPGALRLLRVADEIGMPVVIVSNNAGQAVQRYLDRHGFTEYISGVAARSDDMDPQLLKPHPHLLETGIVIAGMHAIDAVFIGDSVGDIEAGRLAETASIGYANKLGKRQLLAKAGADFVIDNLQLLVDALQPTTARPTT